MTVDSSNLSFRSVDIIIFFDLSIQSTVVNYEVTHVTIMPVLFSAVWVPGRWDTLSEEYHQLRELLAWGKSVSPHPD